MEVKCIVRKVDNHYLVNILIRTLIFEKYVVGVSMKMDTKETCVSKRLNCVFKI